MVQFEDLVERAFGALDTTGAIGFPAEKAVDCYSHYGLPRSSQIKLFLCSRSSRLKLSELSEKNFLSIESFGESNESSSETIETSTGDWIPKVKKSSCDSTPLEHR